MATLTKLESKLAEVLGLAMAAQDAAQQVRGMLGSEHAALAKRLAKARDEARETQKRCTALAGTFKGKKTAILDSARETKQEATEMREAYLGGEDDPLDGFEFLTMAEAGEVGHWSIVAKFNEKAGNAELSKLTDWALPIQQRHLQEALDGSLKLAADEEPDEEAWRVPLPYATLDLERDDRLRPRRGADQGPLGDRVQTVHFREVHAKDGSRIEHRRICPKHRDGKAIDYDDIVKGFEVSKGKWVELTDDEIAAAAGGQSQPDRRRPLRPRRRHRARVLRAHLLPGRQDKGKDAYALLHAALDRSGRAGVGRWVFHNRERTVVMRTLDDVLALHTMRFADELVDPDDLELRARAAQAERPRDQDGLLAGRRACTPSSIRARTRTPTATPS